MPIVSVTAVVEDTDEGSATGVSRVLAQPSVISAANALRDAIVAVAAAGGKPVTF